MSNPKRTPAFSAMGGRTNIRMSKAARSLQTAAARTNWNDVAKLLFRVDANNGRNEEIRKLSILKPIIPKNVWVSYNSDQLHYILFLMLVISIAEQRTEELYRQKFAARCDSISERYALKDDDYWPDAKTPSEWEALDKEFEELSLQILVETLMEYHQEEIAAVVQTEGREQFFEIIHNIQFHFLRVLQNSKTLTAAATDAGTGSIPESLYTFLQPRKN